MTARLYEWMAGLARTRGMWVFKIYTWIVAAGFFAFYPPGVARGVRFYRSLFPEKNVLHLLGCVWRQYRNFTTIFEDRFVLEESGGISYKYEGWEHIEKALMDKTGGIVLMSHMGNWEAAARLLKEKAPDASLLL